MASNKIARESDMKIIADEVIGHADISEIGDGTTRGAIKEIDGELATVKENIETHNGQIGDLESDVATVKERFSTLEVDEKGLELFGWIAPVINGVGDYIADGVYHKKIGRVDLSELSWTSIWTNENKAFGSSAPVSNIKNSSKIECGSYKVFPSSSELRDSTSNGISCSTDGYMQIRDSAYSDATSFRNSLRGKYLYYELEQEQTASIYNPNVLDTIGKTTNLLNPTAQSQVVNGISVANNGDGTYTINGTATSTVWVALMSGVPLNSGTYKLIVNNETSNVWIHIREDEFSPIVTNTTDTNTIKSGNYVCWLVVGKGNTVSNVTVKPMLTTNLQATYDDFVPYTGSTGKLNSDVAELQKITTEDLSGILNITASNKKLTAMKCGKVVSLFLTLDKITLETGQFPIGQITEKYRPITSVTQSIHSRNIGTWATAEYYPAVLSITEGGTLYIRAGENYSNIQYVEGCIIYLVEK